MNAAQRKFLAYVIECKPKSVEDLRPAYHPRFMDEGAFRKAFDVRLGCYKSLGLVIKFPAGTDGATRAESLAHAQDEVTALGRINNETHLLALKRYMPEVLYFDATNGVTVMPKYEKVPWTMMFGGFVNTFECMLADLMPEMRYEFDSGNANFGLTAKKEYVVLDLGLIGAVNLSVLKRKR